MLHQPIVNQQANVNKQLIKIFVSEERQKLAILKNWGPLSMKIANLEYWRQ